MVEDDLIEHVVQNKVITAALDELEATVEELEGDSENAAQWQWIYDMYHIINKIDGMMMWNCCRTYEICIKLMNGAPDSARVSLYSKNSKFGIWGDSTHPTVYWTTSAKSATANAGASDNWMNYGDHTWLSKEADFHWNVDTYNAWVKNMTVTMTKYTSNPSAGTVALLKTYLAEFKTTIEFMNNLYENLWKGFKLNGSSTITEFKEQKEIIAQAFNVISEGEAWMNGTN